MGTDYKSQIKLAEKHLKEGKEILKEMRATRPPSFDSLNDASVWQAKAAGFLKENFGTDSDCYKRSVQSYGIASYPGDPSAHDRALQRTEDDTEKCIGILKEAIKDLELKEKVKLGIEKEIPDNDKLKYGDYNLAFYDKTGNKVEVQVVELIRLVVKIARESM